MTGVFPVLGGERQQHTGQSPNGADLHTANTCVSMRAAHEGAPRHARKHDIIDELSLAAQKSRVLAAAQRLADKSFRPALPGLREN
jgi:hypothetical protein